MSYFMVRSVSQTTSVDMFTLGVSTSRGDATKIGQFGSGTLMATLLWLRLFGESPLYIINGKRVEFLSRPEKMGNGKVFHRVFQVEDGKETPLTVSLEYGELDWTSAYMALREWISNALDNGMSIEESISVQSETAEDPDEVRVYIPMNSECRKYWQNIDQYFLQFSGRSHQNLIEKDKVSPCRLYRRGVFMKELEEASTFDYNLDFDISESRNGSTDSMLETVYYFIRKGEHTDENTRELFHSVANLNSKVECSSVCSYSEMSDSWKRLIAGIGMFSNSHIEGQHTAIISNYSLFSWFKRNVPHLCYEKKKEEADNSEVTVTLTSETLDLFNKACQLIKDFGLTNGKFEPSIKLFKTGSGLPPKYLGRYDKKAQTIYIWRDNAASFQTVLEEVCHHYSGQTDDTRGFQEYLFRLITEIVS